MIIDLCVDVCMYLLSSRNAAFERLGSESHLRRLDSSSGVSGEGAMVVSCETCGSPSPFLLCMVLVTEGQWQPENLNCRILR